MSGGMLGIGVSALSASQRSLQTVSQNIANANTEGYSRQRVLQSTQTPVFQGSFYLGTGVTTSSIDRIYDSFLTGEVRTYTSSFNQAQSYAKYADALDEMLADSQIGLMPAVEEFFSTVQGVANDPSAMPARQAMLSQGETLVDRFRYIDQRFSEVREQVDQQVGSLVAEVNSLAAGIADLNRSIVLAPGRGQPNDLLDQRDILLNQLAEKVSVTTLEQDNGAIDVFIGKGQILVLNFDSSELQITRNQYDIRQSEISIDTGAPSPVEISSFISGGQLGGLVNFRDNVLNSSQNALGSLAIGMADTFNAQQRLGQDLDGVLGSNFFTSPTLQVLPASGSPSTVVANLSDSSQLTKDDYQLVYNGGDVYTLTNLSTNATSTVNTGGSYPYTSVDTDGFNLTITAGAVAGDSFLIRPGRLGALELDVALTSGRQIAAASPIRTERALTNTGSGEISAGVASNVAAAPTGTGLGGDVTLTYNGGNIQISGASVLGSPVSVAYAPPNQAISIAFGGDIGAVDISISGTLQDGDSFTITDNAAGSSDNRNILNLGALQTTRLMDGGAASYDEYYSGMVAEVGIQTNQANITKDAQSRLLDQALNARDSLSGVNLDEEAANLMKFQQAYQAASQLIVASNSMFQSLLAALRA